MFKCVYLKKFKNQNLMIFFFLTFNEKKIESKPHFLQWLNIARVCCKVIVIHKCACVCVM